MRAALDRLQAMRVDFVKITENTLTPELYLLGVARGRARGFTVSAHVPVALTLDQVVRGRARVDRAHVVSAARRLAARGGAERRRRGREDAGRRRRDGDGRRLRRGDGAGDLGRLAARGTAVTPTLNGSRILAYLDQDTHAQDDYLKYLGRGPEGHLRGPRDPCRRRRRRGGGPPPRPVREGGAAAAAVAAGGRHDSGRHRRRLPQLVQLSGHRAARRARRCW